MQRQPVVLTTWLDAYTVHRHPPANMRPEQSALFSHEFRRDFGPVHLHRIAGATVTTDGFILKAGKVLPINHVSTDHRKEFGWRYHLEQVLRKKRIRLNPDHRYALCFDFWSNAYYHWICDALPRFMHLQSIDPGLIFLLPEAQYKGYVKQTLESLGIMQLQLIPPNANVVVPELLVLDHLAGSGNFHPESMRKLRDRMVMPRAPEQAGNLRLYGSRAKAQFKFIVNEEDVVRTLKEYQVDTCYFEDLTFYEQLSAMQRNSLMVGMHGANLTNMLFMPGNGIVLEFREHGDRQNNCFYSLANAMGHTYYCQFCQRGDRTYEHSNRFDLVVDTAELRVNMERIMDDLHARLHT